jgi:hypothetical protein
MTNKTRSKSRRRRSAGSAPGRGDKSRSGSRGKSPSKGGGRGTGQGGPPNRSRRGGSNRQRAAYDNSVERPRVSRGRSDTFEDLFAEQPKEVKAIGTRLREIVQDVLPNSEEKVYLGWKIALYCEPAEVCGIQLVNKFCNLYFSKGAEMNDPEGLLEGTGKSIRHVKVRSTEGIPEDQLKALILEAKKVAK